MSLQLSHRTPRDTAEPDHGCHAIKAGEVFDYAWHDLLVERWRRAAEGGRLPTRADFDPIDLRFCLGNLALVEPLPGGRDFRYRVFGSALAAMLGMDLTGRLVSDLPHAVRQPLLDCYARCVADGVPYYSWSRGAGPARSWNWSRVMLPLSDGGRLVRQVLTLVIPDSLGDPAF
ncbi:MAG: hypothetical protein OHK0024_21870 [Thalassobaculales bacterium]